MSLDKKITRAPLSKNAHTASPKVSGHKRNQFASAQWPIYCRAEQAFGAHDLRILSARDGASVLVAIRNGNIYEAIYATQDIAAIHFGIEPELAN